MRGDREAADKGTAYHTMNDKRNSKEECTGERAKHCSDSEVWMQTPLP